MPAEYWTYRTYCQGSHGHQKCGKVLEMQVQYEGIEKNMDFTLLGMFYDFVLFVLYEVYRTLKTFLTYCM